MAVILIGDENPTFLNELRQVLVAEEYSVETTTKACHILSNLLSQPIAALILGTRLQGIDSPDLLPIIKQLDEFLPIIVVGDSPSLKIERQVRTYQIFYYLMKPVDRRELLTVIRQAVYKRRHPSGRGFVFHQPSTSGGEDPEEIMGT